MDLGLERAGMECAWQVEIDGFCRNVLTKHWPNVPKFNDVREVGKHNLERVDLIAGGFPCQDVSTSRTAGRDGLDGKRSGLWAEFHRIICEVRPRYIFVENVTGLLSNGMGRVLGDLVSCGYDTEWQSIPASAVGAPTIRDRVWILAYPGQEHERFKGRAKTRARCVDVFPQGDNRTAPERREDRELVTLVPGIHSGVVADWWRSQSRMDRSSNGIPDWVDRCMGLGNAVVPQVAEWIGKRILEAEETS